MKTVRNVSQTNKRKYTKIQFAIEDKLNALRKILMQRKFTLDEQHYWNKLNGVTYKIYLLRNV